MDRKYCLSIMYARKHEHKKYSHENMIFNIKLPERPKFYSTSAQVVSVVKICYTCTKNGAKTFQIFKPFKETKSEKGRDRQIVRQRIGNLSQSEKIRFNPSSRKT